MIHDSADELFSQALQDFKSSLSATDQQTFRAVQDANSMLSQLRLVFVSNQDSRSLRACQKVSSFSDVMSSYFDVINTFMNTHPDYTGWFWGTILLICKVCYMKNSFYSYQF